MLSFFAGAFALAGLAAAAGPTIIHLLNRRRYRVVSWAAMDFLREALQRSRRILHIRDLVLLALRTLVVLLFGLAMARPYWSDSGDAASPDDPVHAVLVIDNSLSMAAARLDGTLLDEAKTRARDFVGTLPSGSWVSILPLCGAPLGFSRDAYRTREDAIEAIDSVSIVDREGTAAHAVDLAHEAMDGVPELPSKRVIFIGDQQRVFWASASGEASGRLLGLPNLQVVSVGTPGIENAWVAEFRLQGGIADAGSPAAFIVVVKYEGPAPREGAQVTLSLSGTPVASQSVRLEPGQSRELVFTHAIDLAVESGRPRFLAARASLEPDRLPLDDERFLVVPVLADLPVTFVDPYGSDEDPKRGHYGETYPLRRLLAPSSGGAESRELAKSRLLRIEEVSRSTLEDARLVAIAGVENPPAAAVEVLREYVRQGGQLLLAAGGAFDPAAWSAAAWLEGDGILPLPLEPRAIGVLPEDAVGVLNPFLLDTASLSESFFRLEGADPQETADLYLTPLFFKFAGARLLSAAEEAGIPEFAPPRAPAPASSPGPAPTPSPTPTPTESLDPASREPRWLLWRAQDLDAVDDRSGPMAGAGDGRPRILASFQDGHPALVERSLGRGRVLFFASGLQSSWCTIARTHAVILFDRIARDAIERTLPRRVFGTTEQVSFRIDPSQRRARFALERPGGAKEILVAEALGPDTFGLPLRGATRRGIYRIDASREESQGAGGKLFELECAVNGPERESSLLRIAETALRERLGSLPFRWVGPGEPISIDAAQVGVSSLWKWILVAVLALLALEMGILAWPALRGSRAAPAGESVRSAVGGSLGP